jgi:sugar/nucleoside kinase (ribokinase family)
MEKTSFDVIGFGSATLDYICIVDGIANHGQAIFISDVKIFGGGCVPTALVTLERFGVKTAFVSLLGNDWIGKEIIKGLERENINCNAIEFTEKISSPFSFIQVNRNLGTRAIAYYPGSSKFLKFDGSAKKLIRNAKILHIDGFTPEEDLKAADFARSNKVKVMLDANMLLNGTKELLSSVDYLITSEAFLFEYSNMQDVSLSLKKIYKDFKPEILVTTLGEKGSVAVIDGKIVFIDSFNVNVVDTTGAGDVYHGAFLFGILNNWNIGDIIIFSSAVSAINCTSYGGRKGIPDYETTIDFLNKRGISIERFKS